MILTPFYVSFERDGIRYFYLIAHCVGMFHVNTKFSEHMQVFTGLCQICLAGIGAHLHQHFPGQLQGPQGAAAGTSAVLEIFLSREFALKKFDVQCSSY